MVGGFSGAEPVHKSIGDSCRSRSPYPTNENPDSTQAGRLSVQKEHNTTRRNAMQLAWRLGLTADCQTPVQNRTVCFVSSACCFLVSAEAMLRARPAAAFTLLNHILINGFFFNQGFAIYVFLIDGCKRDCCGFAALPSKASSLTIASRKSRCCSAQRARRIH